MKNYYETHVVVDRKLREKIEESTRQQSTADDSNARELWYAERKKRITASVVGGIAKMKSSTKRAKKVQELLYNKFHGNSSTMFGVAKEAVS